LVAELTLAPFAYVLRPLASLPTPKHYERHELRFDITLDFGSLVDSMATVHGPAGGMPGRVLKRCATWMGAKHIASYPRKLYMERVRLWYRVYDGVDENVGLFLAGRLRSRAQQIALGLRLPDPHGHVDTGDAALVRLSVEEDPDSGQIIQHAIPSGVQALMTALRAAFGEASQLQATRALETFFEFRRNKMSIPEWSVQRQLNLDEAITHSGLDLNNVAKTYLYFKSPGLAQKSLDDILLHVHGDMRRFEEGRALMLCMAHPSTETSGSTLHYEDSRQNDGSWSAVTDYWSEDGYLTDDLYAWFESDWHYSPWVYETAAIYFEDWPAEHYGWDDEEPAHAEEGEQQQLQESNPEESDEYFKGKAKAVFRSWDLDAAPADQSGKAPTLAQRMTPTKARTRPLARASRLPPKEEPTPKKEFWLFWRLLIT